MVKILKFKNKLLIELVSINVGFAIVSTLLATIGIKKKCKITEENKKTIFRNISIFLVIMAVLMIVFHNVIINSLFCDYDIQDMQQDYINEEDGILTAYEEEGLQLIKNFSILINVYLYDFVVFVVMIPIEYLLIVKKER